MDNPFTELKYMQGFGDVIPESAVSVFEALFATHPLQIRMVKERRSKFGDFRCARYKEKATITVNRGMSADATIFILAHEAAHYFVHSQRRANQAHGHLWKQTFGMILQKLLEGNCFGENVAAEIQKYLHNPTATVKRNSKLFTALFNYMKFDTGHIALENISVGAKFTIGQSPRIYEKQYKRRTRYVCRCVQNNRQYLVSEHLLVNSLE